MTWFKLDDNFPRHPKVVRAGTDAAWLFVAGGCYCAQYLTDGSIPKDALAGLTGLKQPAKLAARLVEVGLWYDLGDHFEVHGFLDYNPSREHVEKERRQAAERRARGGRTSGERRANVMNPDPTRPDVLTERVGARSAPRRNGSRIPDEFEVNPVMQSWADEKCPLVNWRFHTERFVNHWKAKAGKDAVKLDWERTWRNWMLEEQHRETTRRPTSLRAL